MRPARLRMWPPLPPDVYLRRPTQDPPFPLAAPDCLLLRKARQALFFGIQGLGLQPGDEVLLPAYHHGSEVEAFRRTGLTCRFYDLGPTLGPDLAALEGLVGPRTRVLYLIHYLGFPQDAPWWRRWCRERELLLIEDVAQSWLASVEGRPLGSFGDMAIFSFYKAVGLPEGGALWSSRPTEVAVQRRPGGTARLLRQLASRHEAWLTSRSSLAASLRTGSTHRWRSSAWTFHLGKVHAAPSRILPFLLPRLLEPDPAETRRGHYRVLLSELAGQVPAALSVLPDGASPYFFPVHTTDKPGLISLLDEHEIDAVDFWGMPHPSLPAAAFPMAGQFRASIVGVPVHQELRGGDLERIVSVVRQWGARARTRQSRTGAVPRRVQT
jgi:dTDP-4-amino-4,6-dideoxygalactose transaminase